MIQDIFPGPAGHEFAAFLEQKPRVIYAGFDPTAESLHIGNLLIIMPLLHALRAGHQVIALVGGATARIGDPSGKTIERPLIPNETVQKNLSGVTNNLKAVFANHAKLMGETSNHDLVSNVKFVDNYDWYKDLNILDFLQTTGRHFRLGRMLTRKVVKDRIDSEEGLSLTEFSYQTFQAYDWLHLFDKYGCTVQLGGSDQMGNIHAGHELIQRMRSSCVYGITMPLITSEKGEKLGKTAGTPMWLSESKTSCFDMFQYFLRLPDSQVEKMLKLFSFYSEAEIRDILNKHTRAPEKRSAQTKLAEHVTLLVHGEVGLEKALNATRVLYDSDVSTLAKCSADELRTIFEQADSVQLLFTPGLTLVDFALKVGCFRTEKDALRIIGAGGFYVNQVRRQNPEEVVMPGNHILPNETSLVRVGKRNYYIVEWSL